VSPDEAIRHFRHHLLSGAFGDRELLLPSEVDYSGMWSALCAHLPAWEQRFGFDNPVVHEVRTAIHEIADRRPDAVKVFALATTRYGREGGE
jgi:hypothetical protein